MDVAESFKTIGAAFAAASALGYMAGYLAVRARAYALGTDPGFKLIDEAYVFAGFRLLFITLLVLLLFSPLLLVARAAGGWFDARLSVQAGAAVRWSVLGALALLTVLELDVLGSPGLLLRREPATKPLAAATLGQRSSLPWTLLSTLLPALCGLWLHARIATERGTFEIGLALVTLLQLFLLPIFHGVLVADRKVRVLAQRPAALAQMNGPIGIVDRTSEHVALLTSDTNGARLLTVLPIESLDGIGVERIVSIKEFMDELKQANTAPIEPKAAPSIYEGSPRKEARMKSIRSESNDNFFDFIANHLRMRFEAIGALGESPVGEGELWEARLDANGGVSSRHRIGTRDDLSWPVGRPGSPAIQALQDGRLVTIEGDGALTEAAPVPRWRKLLGITSDGTTVGFAMDDAGEPVPALLSEGGALRIGPPPAPDEGCKVSRLLDETRSYTGGGELTVDRSERGGRGFDVFLTLNGRTVNVTDSGDDSCGQASLGSEPPRVLYIRVPSY